MLHGDTVIGSATLILEKKFIRNGGLCAHIEDVIIDEKYRGMGLGDELVSTLIEVAKRKHCYKIILDCNTVNKGFYEKLGFKQHEIQMRIDL